MYPSRRKNRLPKTNFMNLKTVEVPRGRNGYGFTVSGQSPCVLSCILHGSPAEIAGLKAGDSVIAVNGENVTRLSHEQIIKLIGATTGVLRLTVAEVDYTESSDDEYVYMPRSRYPHNKRSQSATPVSMLGKPRAEMVVEEMQQGALLDSFTAMQGDLPQAMLRGAEVQRIQAELPGSHSKFAPGHLSPLNKTGNPDFVLKKSSNYDYSYWNGKNFERVPGKNRKIKRQTTDPRNRMFSTPTPTSYYIRENPYDDTDQDMRPLSPVELSNIMYPGNDSTHSAARPIHKSTPIQGNVSHSATQEEMCGTSLMENDENVHMRAMVGYLGSIDIPASANLPTASLHAIRGCVRRLHKEHRVHSFMMMEIATDGVRLVNSNQRIAVMYPKERLAFSGVCPDDKRFFGIVTTQNPEEMIDTMDSDEEPIGSSCHVFMVDPEYMRHDVHARVISQFGNICQTNAETNTCDIFPPSAKPILQRVSQLYQDRSDMSYFGELYNQSPFVSGPRRSNSTNSSNSDSGFGNGNSKDQSDFAGHFEQSAILDVASMMRNKRKGHPAVRHSTSSHVVHADINTSLSSDIPYSDSTSPQSMDTSPQNMFFKHTKDVSGRLTPRARPDPVGIGSSSVAPHLENSYQYQQVRRPASVQVPLQSNILPSAMMPLQSHPAPQSGNDFHLQKPNAESSGSSTLEDNSQRSKELMGPPKGLPPSGRHSAYSRQVTDYPAAAIDQMTARKVQEEMSRRLSERHFFPQHKQQNMQLLRRNSDCSEYSSSTRLSKQVVEKLQKIRQDSSHLTVPNLQIMTASDGALIADGKGIHGSASNPNLAAQVGHAPELDPSVGRVSSWAVDFERLLHDELGLACFTEFLKKEFSDENIMFWIACERMSKITDQKELRRMAQDIYDKHLGPAAYNQVNLDASTRSMVEGALKNPTPEMFRAQQQQIFKLMKFDSYARFLKSKLYQDCVLAEMGGLPLPISLEHIPSDHPTDNTAASRAEPDVSGGIVHVGVAGSSAALPHGRVGESNGGVSTEGTVKDQMNRKKSNKKDQQRQKLSVSEDEDQEKRKTSILPWRNKKKSKDGDKHLNSSGNEDTSLSSRHSSVTSSDFRPAGEKFVDMNNCYHMIFPNNEILTMTPEPQQTVQDVLNPLLKERGLCLQNVEIFLNDTKELINMTQMTTAMVGRQIVVERRVVFKIELPNKRVIGVKSKLTKKIIEVLRPVTYKYNLQLDALVVHLSESPVPLDLDITVASLDGQRILIETLEQYSAGSYAVSGRAPVGPTTNNNSSTKPDNRAASVDSFLKEDEVIRANPIQGKKEKLKTQLSMPAMSVSSSQPPVGDTMRDKRAMSGSIPTTAPEVKNLPSTSLSTSALPGGGGRTEGRKVGNLRVTGNDAEDLIAIVSKVQSKRLDDQRGLTLRNLELPDFLKVTQAPTSTTSSQPTESRPKSALGLPINANMPDASSRLQQDGQLKAADIDALNLRPKSTPPRQVALGQGDGFTDGILPTNSQAEQLFMGGSPRTPIVRFDDTVVKSTYKDTTWDQRAYNNYPRQSSTEGSFQTGMSKFFSPEDKLSPRAFGGSHSHGGGTDSTDHGLNTTAYSLEFNSSFGSTDQPNLDTTVTSTSSESQLPPPPSPDLDTTIKADLPNYTPPPALGGQTQVSHRGGSGYPSKTSLIVPDIREKPIIHPFTAGSTLPGHDLEAASKLILKSNHYAINGYPPSSLAVASQLSSSNNNSTKLSSMSKAPDIQAESGNCYSNYSPFPTTSNGSFYDGSDDTNANSQPGMAPQPDVTQVCAKERIIKPPPAYTSSMTTKPAKAPYSSSEDLRSAAPNPRHQGKAQGVGQGSGWGVHVTSTSQGNTVKTYTSRNGSQQAAPSVVNIPLKSMPHGVRVAPTTTPSGTFAPRMQHAPYTGAPGLSTRSVPRPSTTATHGGQGGAPRGADSRLTPSTTKDPKVATGASPDFQGKESVVFSKDGRKVRATFV